MARDAVTAQQTGTAAPPLPAGFSVHFDPGTKQLTDSILFGGSPAKAMLLSPAGCAALGELRTGPIKSAAAGLLGRRLTDAGMAHPRPRPCRADLGVTVLIPVRDRIAELDRCLGAVGSEYPVLVVDDGSTDPATVTDIAERHGATVLHRDENGGPAAARNTGLAAISSEFVAFLDSDCVPGPNWIEPLAAHFNDDAVGAVAPRIVAMAAQPTEHRSAASEYAAARGSLDLGPLEARVVPATKVAYVPTAALLVRRDALQSVAGTGPAFDPLLRYGEDVDLIWRLHDAGWRIRYEPAVQMRHDGPSTWPSLVAKRFQYGTSAAPLATRHPGRLAPLVLQPWPTLAVAALLARRPAAAAAAATAGWLTMARTVRRAGLPADGAAAATLTAIHQTWLGVGRYATQFAAPALAAAIVQPGGGARGRRWGRRSAAASLLLGPAVEAWRASRRPNGEAADSAPGLDPVRFVLAHVAEDVGYGAGVWAGCARERTLAPVQPRISWRPLRVSGPASAGVSTSREGSATDG